MNNSFDGTKHKCAKWVRSAIDVGFGTNPNGNNSYTGAHGRPEWAYSYSTFLPKIGFKKVASMTSNEANSYTPQKGDIAVYKMGTKSDYPGHICMWTGSKWCSDFKQRNMYVYGSLYTPIIDVFRYDNSSA